MSSKRAATSRTGLNEDAERSVAEWKTLDLVSLRLKCNQYSLVEKGVKDTLAKRLHAHFEVDRRRIESTHHGSDHDSVSSSESDENDTETASNDGSEIDPNSIQIELSRDDGFSLDEDENDETERNQNGGDDTGSDNNVENGIQDGGRFPRERDGTVTTNNDGYTENHNGAPTDHNNIATTVSDELLCELRALRSEVRAVKTKQTQFDNIIQNQSPPVNASTNKNYNINNARKRKTSSRKDGPINKRSKGRKTNNNNRTQTTSNSKKSQPTLVQNKNITQTQTNNRLQTDTQQRIARLANPLANHNTSNVPVSINPKNTNQHVITVNIR